MENGGKFEFKLGIEINLSFELNLEVFDMFLPFGFPSLLDSSIRGFLSGK